MCPFFGGYNNSELHGMKKRNKEFSGTKNVYKIFLVRGRIDTPTLHTFLRLRIFGIVLSGLRSQRESSC